MRKIFLLLALLPALFYGSPRSELEKHYIQAYRTRSDINEHIIPLNTLAKECSSVIEIGVRDIVSTWGLLRGLANSSEGNLAYLGIDLVMPPAHRLDLARRLAERNQIAFNFLIADDLHIEIPPTDMLFIDSLHTYCHLMSELERFSPQVRKYIAMHDTSDPWGEVDDWAYNGDYSEYPAHFDRTKRGLWAAVVDFLENHPEWMLKERRLNCHGLTVLKRR